jgi:hypothetical protein
VIRYKGGLVDHFRVKLTGAFRADGATLEARPDHPARAPLPAVREREAGVGGAGMT